MVRLARSGGALRGTRIGAGPMGESERGDTVARIRVSYFCSRGHGTTPSFALDVAVPEVWDCPRCGLPAGRDQANPPAANVAVPFKSHLAYVRERRTAEDAEVLLNEALARLRFSEQGA